jgi:hypothetical protein
MSLSRPTAAADLAQTAAAIAHWRSSVPRRSRIPDEFWSQAVELVDRHGVGTVARALRLDYTALKRRVTRSCKGTVPTVAAAPPAAFVEYPFGLAGAGASCVVALSDPCGRLLRIEWTGAAVGEVAAVARSLWEAAS